MIRTAILQSECNRMVIIPVSFQHCTVVLGNAHTRSTPSLSNIPKAGLETVIVLVWFSQHTFLRTLEG